MPLGSSQCPLTRIVDGLGTRLAWYRKPRNCKRDATDRYGRNCNHEAVFICYLTPNCSTFCLQKPLHDPTTPRLYNASTRASERILTLLSPGAYRPYYFTVDVWRMSLGRAVLFSSRVRQAPLPYLNMSFTFSFMALHRLLVPRFWGYDL